MDSNPTRKTSTPIKVWCLPVEHATIAANARSVGLSKSAYLRNVGLGYRVDSVVDAQRITEMARINGDLGRLGGLLKLWLTKPERLKEFGESRIRDSIEGTLDRIYANQAALRAVIDKLADENFSG